MNRIVKIAFLPILGMGLVSCLGEDENSCSTNGSGSWAGYDVCYTLVGENYTRGVFISGDSSESMRIVVQGDARAPYSQIDLSSISYNLPRDTIDHFETGVEYFNIHAYPFIQNAVEIKDGTFKFTKFDRAARKISGNFTYTYVENLSQGNVDRVVSVRFADAAY